MAAAALAAALATGSGAQAQDDVGTPDRLSVLERPREDYDPLGVRLGHYILDPSIDVLGVYDSNIYATPRGTRSDYINSVIPALSVQTDWARHALGFKAQGEIKDYAIHSSEDVNNVTVAANGRYDIARDVYFLGGGGYELLHEDRGSTDVLQGRYPTQFTVASGNAGFVFAPTRLGFRLDGTVDSYAFDNVPAGTGPVVNETSRDRVVYALTPRVSYEITPQYNAFLRAVVNRRQYNSTRELDGLDRSSDGYQIDLGSSLNLAELITGDAYLGYIQQQYDQEASREISGADFGANLLWNLTQITSLRLNVARTIEESTIPNSLGFLQTSAKLTLEHELLRNVVLSGSLTYINADFENVPGSSNFYEASFGARYLFNHYFSAGLEYELRHRSPIEFLPSFTRQIVGLRVRAQL
ncbi:MAG: outer membrane beta-barrel protein [Alphaproteobacteria bacterium]|nr:outer membrane beta-barrel protein [Alphaproteobacteria bacterium]